MILRESTVASFVDQSGNGTYTVHVDGKEVERGEIKNGVRICTKIVDANGDNYVKDADLSLIIDVLKAGLGPHRVLFSDYERKLVDEVAPRYAKYKGRLAASEKTLNVFREIHQKLRL